MFKVDFLVMLCQNAKIYKYHGLKTLLQEITGETISIESASKILDPYLNMIKEVEKDQEIMDWVYKQFKEYKKIFLNNLFQNSHINGYNGTSIISENNATAILLDFVNYLSSVSLVDIIFYI